MKKYLVEMRLRVGGSVYKVGDIVELSDTQATPLLKMNVITMAHVVEPVVSVTPTIAPAIEIATPVTAPVVTPMPTVEPISSEPVSNDSTPSATPVAPIETAEPAEPVATPTEAQTSMVNAYSNFTKAQLNAELDKRGIAHDSKATNDVLESLLVADDNKAV